VGLRTRKVVHRDTPAAQLSVQLKAEIKLSKGAGELIETLAKRHPMRLTPRQLSTFSKRSMRSSIWGPTLKEIVDCGYVERVGGLLGLTPSGQEAFKAYLGTGQSAGDIRAAWRSSLPPNAARMFDVLVAADEALRREELADRAGISRRSSGLGDGLKVLRQNNLIVEEAGYISASPDLIG
jgi:hypothetical protein